MPRLTYLNYLNCAGLLANFVMSIGWTNEGAVEGNQGFNEGNQGFDDFARRYLGILTPAEFTFGFEQIAFTLQAVFVLIQMMPTYRALPVVQKGVSVWYFAASFCQSFWLLILNKFEEEGGAEEGEERQIAISQQFLLTTVMAGVLVFFSLVVYMQGKVERDGSQEDFWLLRFPFSFSCGWTIVKFLITFNAPFADMEQQNGQNVYYNSRFPLTTQVIFLCISFLAMLLVSIYVIRYAPHISPDYTIALILAFSAYGMAIHMSSEEMQDHFDDGEEGTLLLTFQYIAYTIATAILFGTFIYAFKVDQDENEIEKESFYEGASIEMSGSNETANTSGSQNSPPRGNRNDSNQTEERRPESVV